MKSDIVKKYSLLFKFNISGLVLTDGSVQKKKKYHRRVDS